MHEEVERGGACEDQRPCDQRGQQLAQPLAHSFNLRKNRSFSTNFYRPLMTNNEILAEYFDFRNK